MSGAPPSPLLDSAERELAAGDLSTTYIVEAAAGTGKTTLLVSRILTIVRETLTPLSQVAAITFTEKAAAELKQRVRERLEAEAHGAGEGMERCAAALRDVDAMPVSTVHSFCADLLRQRPVEADVDPNFAMVDQQTAQALLDEAWHDWLHAELDGNAGIAAQFLELGLPLTAAFEQTSLRSLFATLWTNREDLAALHTAAESQTRLREILRTFHATAQSACTLAARCRNAQDSLVQQIYAVAHWLTAPELDDLPAALLWLQRRPSLHGGYKGSAPNWDPAALADAREYFLRRFAADADACACAIVSRLAAALVEWLKSGVRVVQQRLREQGILDFHDLLITARAMLRDSGAAREYFKQRYAYLLVDEFQDTDPLQAEIVFFLCEKPGRHAQDWRDTALDDGKLFIVGDPKQSVYRFRRADLDLYGAVREQIEAQGRYVPIRVNFRSDPALITEINAIFDVWMTGPEDGRYEPEYVAMQPHRPRQADAACTVLLPPPQNFSLLQQTDELAAAEAACIAEYITECRRAEERDFAYRRFGILYPVATHLNVLENALKSRSIPYQTAGEREIGARIEITTLHTVLAAIDNPHDDVAVAGALRSAFFGCSDEELLEHRMADGVFNYMAADSVVTHIQTCFTVLRELHTQRRSRLPSETIGELFSRSAGLQVFALKPRGERRVALLLRVLDLARAFEQTGNYSLTRFVCWLGRLDELPALDTDSAAADESDAVQLLTFHKAKGLEFPVVILFGIERSQPRRRAEIINRHTKSVEFRFAKFQTAGYAVADAEEQRRQRAETARLLYVAMTRARDRLVIPAYWCKGGVVKGERQWILEILASRFPVAADGRPDPRNSGFVLHDTDAYALHTPLDERLVLNPADVEPDAEPAVERPAWQVRRDDAVAVFQRERQFRRPSAHAQAPQPAAAAKKTDASVMVFGSFVHRMLEQTAFPGGENREAVIASAAREFRLAPETVAAGRELLERALRCEALQTQVTTADRVFRELEFVLETDGVLTEGAMDLVLIKGDSAVIVDYKSDAVDAQGAAQRAGFYREQARVYAQALERIAHVNVGEVWLYFLRPDRIVRLPRDQLTADAPAR